MEFPSFIGSDIAEPASGGKEELRQAARRVREARRKPVAEAAPDEAGPQEEPADSIESLRRRVAALTAENQQLREQLARMGHALASAR